MTWCDWYRRNWTTEGGVGTPVGRCHGVLMTVVGVSNAMNEPKESYVVEHWIYHAKPRRWRPVTFCETASEALEKLDKVGLHRQDKARAKEQNTGRTIGERTGID